MPRIARQSRSLTKNALWLTLAKSIAFGATFLLPILLVRQMSQTEFGLYKQVFLAVNTMVTALPVGFTMSAFYFLPREPLRKGLVVQNIVVFYLCVAGVSGLGLILYPGLLPALFGSPELASYAREVGLVVFFWMVSSFFEMVAVAHGETYLAGVFVVASHGARAFLLLLAALWLASLQALIHAALLHGILQTGVLWLYLSFRFPGFWRRFDWAMMRSQLSYALPMGAAALLLIMQMDLHNYVVAHRFGPAAYAIYAVGCFQIPMLGILKESVGTVMISRVSELQKEGDAREILFLTARMIRKVALLVLPMYFLLLVTRREVIGLLFTEQYMASTAIFAINLSMIPLMMIAVGCDPIVRAYPEHLPFVLKVRVCLVGLLLAGLWVGTEYFGLEGAIATVVAVNFIEHVVLGLKLGRVLGASWRHLALFKDVGKLALASLAAAAVATVVREWAGGSDPLVVLLLCGIAFGAMYAVAVLLLGVLTTEEREAIQRKVAYASRW